MQVDAIAAVNAIHLYPDLDEVAANWMRALRPGGRVFINSGNLRNPRAAAGEWILDETVWVINDLAEGLVRSRPEYAAYRPVLDDAERMQAHATQRDRVFLKPRPLQYYTDALTRAGLTVTDVREKTIVATVEEWFELMTAYHDAVLGWVGGNQKLDGRPPTPEAVAGPPEDHAPRDRHDLQRPRGVQGVLDVHHGREAGVTAASSPPPRRSAAAGGGRDAVGARCAACGHAHALRAAALHALPRAARLEPAGFGPGRDGLVDDDAARRAAPGARRRTRWPTSTSTTGRACSRTSTGGPIGTSARACGWPARRAHGDPRR